MKLGDGPLSFQEFIMREPLPLAAIHDAVLDFLRDRKDAALFGAQAVNAYVNEKRMTEDVDILSPRAADLAEELRAHLAERFEIAVRIREIGKGKGYRIYQMRKPQNRHLVDVRPEPSLPRTHTVDRVLVVEPAELIAQKVLALNSRKGSPKWGTDWRDLAQLLLTFPDLKALQGAVRDRLEARAASAEALQTWENLVAEEIREAPEDGEFS
ncbi:MAG: nucleotidyl transferase AbiEii/AbiGii toxin family protein [Planctomycetota bacterium]